MTRYHCKFTRHFFQPKAEFQFQETNDILFTRYLKTLFKLFELKNLAASVLHGVRILDILVVQISTHVCK